MLAEEEDDTRGAGSTIVFWILFIIFTLGALAAIYVYIYLYFGKIQKLYTNRIESSTPFATTPGTTGTEVTDKVVVLTESNNKQVVAVAVKDVRKPSQVLKIEHKEPEKSTPVALPPPHKKRAPVPEETKPEFVPPVVDHRNYDEPCSPSRGLGSIDRSTSNDSLVGAALNAGQFKQLATKDDSFGSSMTRRAPRRSSVKRAGTEEFTSVSTMSPETQADS